MKILKYILLFLLFPLGLSAQQEIGDPGKTWSYPVIYKYDEQVTWYFDLSTTSFSEGQNLYLWIWSPSEPDAGNWGNSSEFAKLKYEGNMVWSFTLTPTVYFNKTAAEIAASAGFWFRLKDKTGSQQSGVAQISYTDFSTFATSGEMVKSYPSAPLIDKGVSILFNANLATGFENAESVHFHSGLNNWDIKQEYQAWLPEFVNKTKLKNLGSGIYKMDLIPKDYYSTPDGYVMQNIVFLFVKNDWAATTPDQIIYAGDVVPPPDPEFRFFPLQVSKKDFLGLIRTNNEVGINKLIYTVTAGSYQFSGEFSGNTAEIKGFINLVSELRDKDVNVIHVLVKDNKGKTISDTDITLKTLD